MYIRTVELAGLKEYKLEGGKMLLLSQVNSPLKILALTWGICDHKMVSAGFQQGKLNKKGESKCYR